MSNAKDAHLGIRLNERKLQDFQDKCRTDLGKSTSDVLREFIDAYLEDRITIKQTEAEKELYT